MAVGIRVNTADTARDLRGLNKRLVTEPLRMAILDVGDTIVKTARTRHYGFTDRSGRLRSSIRREGIETGATSAGVSVGSHLPYALAVEFDHGGRYSYIRKALRENERKVRPVIEKHIDRWISRNKRR